VTELSREHYLDFRFSKYGSFDDDKELADWFVGIFDHHRKDAKPILFRNPLCRDAADAFIAGKFNLAALIIAWGDDYPGDKTIVV
jgi:hypothetical protein